MWCDQWKTADIHPYPAIDSRLQPVILHSQDLNWCWSISVLNGPKINYGTMWEVVFVAQPVSMSFQGFFYIYYCIVCNTAAMTVLPSQYFSKLRNLGVESGLGPIVKVSSCIIHQHQFQYWLHRCLKRSRDGSVPSLCFLCYRWASAFLWLCVGQRL